MVATFEHVDRERCERLFGQTRCALPPGLERRVLAMRLFDLAQRYHFPTPDVPCPASTQLRDKSLDTDQIAGKGFMSFSTSSGFIWQHKERS